ncbi:two-component sensor histidine kinase [Cohnella sp. CIP 111063]|uniref:sensor histidine kinase n=1 Tax=unclassified Cohnella TaxID=2636738 RepID=UPI000B8C518C|nr:MULTISPECIES: sensor histidine kinase [unclassified Cohnella]OXS57401.1 two-component sensor histidine kinase [Cohnella sp. CIP 111063]PRX70848.1 sensor histidine kinase YesM [Cohnella sp. SGD-V74]
MKMIKWLFINRSIRTKIVWSSVLISLIPMLVLSYLFYESSTKSLERTMYRSTNQNAQYVAGYLNQYFRDLSSSALQVYGFARVMNLMEHGRTANDEDYFAVTDSLKNYYTLVSNKNRDAVIKIMIFGKDNRLRDYWSRAASYDSIPFDESIPHYGDMLDLPFQQSLSFTYTDAVLNQDFFVFSITIYDPFYRSKVGSLVFYIQKKELAKVIEANNQAPNVVVLRNSRGETFYHTNDSYADLVPTFPVPDAQLKNKPKLIQFVQRSDLLVGTSYLDNGNLTLTIVYPNEELARHRDNTLLITIGAFVFAMLCISLLSLLAQQYITRPIKQLGQAIKRVRHGDFHVALDQPNRYRDDISELTRNFNFMTEKIRELIEQGYQMQLRNKEAQLLALQMQINPHFLYNTLQTIGGKAVLIGDYDIPEMCRSLGELFRYSFYEGNTESTLGQELAHVGNYVYIQQFRFEDSLQIEFDVPQNLMDAPIIRFVMQPIIENAAVHALRGPDDRQLLIRVQAEARNGEIVLLVRDNGPGIPPEKLAALRGGLEAKSMEVFAGVSIGLKNVHERIRLAYGDPYGLTVDSKPGEGTEIRIRIPYRKRGESHA